MSINKPKTKLQKLSLTLLLALLLVSTFAFLVPQIKTANAATFGNTNQGSITDSAGGGVVIGTSASASSSGTVTSITSIVSSTGNVTAVIYSDDGGPSNKLAQSTPVNASQGGTIQFPISCSVTSGTTYWLCLYNVNGYGYTYTQIGGTNNFATAVSTTPNDPNPPTFIPSAERVLGRNLYIYATYTPTQTTPGPTPTPGQTTNPTPTSTPTPTPIQTPTVTSTPITTPTPATTPTPTTSQTPAPTTTPTQTTTPTPTTTQTPVATTYPTENPTITPTLQTTETPTPTTTPTEGYPTIYIYGIIAAIVIIVIVVAVVVMMRRKK